MLDFYLRALLLAASPKTKKYKMFCYYNFDGFRSVSAKRPTVGYVAFIVLSYCLVAQVFVSLSKSHFKGINKNSANQKFSFQSSPKQRPVKAKGN